MVEGKGFSRRLFFEVPLFLFPRATSQVACLNPTEGWIGHLATAARVLNQ
jgi:hypothetical protein